MKAVSETATDIAEWIRASLTAERMTAAFTVVLALATLALVVTAYFQHMDAVKAIEETKRQHIDAVNAIKATERLAKATEDAVAERWQTSSADLVLKFTNTLHDNRYAKIILEIQSHPSNHPLLLGSRGNRSGKFNGTDIEQFIALFEDLAYFVQDGLITAKMAYDHFSYDFEKTWCNNDIQKVIIDARSTDKSKPGTTDLFYGNFEKIAKEYLAREGQSCKDLDSQ